LLHGDRHSRGCTQACETFEGGGADLQFGGLAVEITCDEAFSKHLEATHLVLNKAARVIATPLLPDCPAQQERGHQDGIGAVDFVS